MDFEICLNGSFLSTYNIEKGERIDFLCISRENDIFNSSMSFSSERLIANDFDFVKDEVIYLFLKKRQKGIIVHFQEELYVGNERILATVFFDGKTYCSLESSNKYNVISLPNGGNNYMVSGSAYGDNIFITFDLNGMKNIKVINSTNFLCVFESCAKNVVIEDNKITIESKPHGILERVTRSTYYVNGENVTCDSKVHKCTNVNVCNHALLGVLFMEAVKDEDFDSILSILDSELSSSLDDIKAYFSNVDDFYPTTKDDTFIMAKNGKKEICKFVYENMKISDILTE